MSVSEALEAGGISPFPSSNKRQAIQGALQRLIVIGRLEAGTPLVETQLAAEFGSSQAPVREALMKLQEAGLVVRNGYRGTVVATTSMDEAREMVAVRLRLETVSYTHLTLLQSARWHWPIVEALGSGCPDRAAAALAEHVNNVIEGMPPLAGDEPE